MNLELAAAAGLLIATLVLAYAVWYIVRGRYIRQRNEAMKEAARKKGPGTAKARDGDWKKDKGSYCYPSINDVMGYGFVNVVKVSDDSFTPSLPEGDPIAVKKEPTWDQSSGTGLKTESNGAVTAVSSDRSRRDPDEPFPERDDRFPKQAETSEDPNEPSREETETDVAYEDLIASQEIVFGNWANRDEDEREDFNPDPSPELIHSINEHPEIVGEPGDPEQDRREVRLGALLLEGLGGEADSFNDRLAEIDEAMKDSTFGAQLLSELSAEMLGDGEDIPDINEI